MHTQLNALGRSSGTYRSSLLYESTGKEGGELEASEVGLSSQSGLNQAPRQRGGMEGELQSEETARQLMLTDLQQPNPDVIHAGPRKDHVPHW